MRSSLNVGRFRDEIIDESLQILRSAPDDETRRLAAETINSTFGEQVYNLWTTWTLTGIVANRRVQNVVGQATPEGVAVMPVIAGHHSVHEIWCLEGDCSG